MVLDAKAMEWAAENGIDTKKLKASKIPIYGKWYYPDIPPGVVLVNLKTGELQKFGPGLRAGEILFVPRDELRKARLGPYANLPETQAGAQTEPEIRVAGDTEAGVIPSFVGPASWDPDIYDPPLAPNESIHLPSPSIFPIVLGLGLAVGLLGLVIHPIQAGLIIAALGILYGIVGGTGWAIENYRDREALEGNGEHAQASHH